MGTFPRLSEEVYTVSRLTQGIKTSLESEYPSLWVEGERAMPSDRLKRYVNLKNLTFILSLVMFIWLIWYFYTGFGGPSELVASLVPIALMIQILSLHENGYIYKRLPPIANQVLVVIYLAICLFAFYHFVTEFEQISIWRQGSYTRTDFVMGLLGRSRTRYIQIDP